MADYINNEAAGDNYTDRCTLGPDFQTRSAVITVANNPALMQFAIGEVGNWRWTDEREFFSIPQSFKVGGIVGLKVRNANPGQVARVLAVLSGPDDVDFEAGLPFGGILSAGGQIVQPGASLTGQVAANGAINAGTGFTIAKGGAGIYTINFTNPFGAAPLVLVTPFNAGQVSAEIVNLTNAACQIALFTTNAGVYTDMVFNFLAQAIA